MSPGAWAVQRERLQVSDPRPPDPSVVQPLSDAVGELVKRWQMADELWQRELAGEWPALLGEAVAKRTRPGRVENKNLLVYVRDSVWLSELNRQKGMLLKKIQTRFGAEKVAFLRLQLDPGER